MDYEENDNPHIWAEDLPKCKKCRGKGYIKSEFTEDCESCKKGCKECGDECPNCDGEGYVEFEDASDEIMREIEKDGYYEDTDDY